jgi:hypothetical protein
MHKVTVSKKSSGGAGGGFCWMKKPFLSGPTHSQPKKIMGVCDEW